MPSQKLTKRSDGRYMVSVYIGMIDGKKKYKSVYGQTPKEVNKKAQDIRNAMEKGIDCFDCNTTFRVWAENYFKHIQNKKTKEQYQINKFRVEYFGQFLNNTPVIKIKLCQIQQAIDKLEKANPTTGKPSSKKTLIGYKSALNQFFEYLQDNRVIEYNPCKNALIAPSAPKQERRAVTREEQKNIVSFEHRGKLPAMIAMYCGLRRGEMTALQWTDVDFEHKTITVNKSFCLKSQTIKAPKTASGVRVVPIPDVLADYLQSIPHSSDYIITNTRGGIMLEGAWERLWVEYMRDYSEHFKTENVFTLHCLRHTYATMLYDAKVDVMTAKKLLGHSDIKTTLGIYTHLSKENETSNIDKLNNFLNNSI